jgi:predicted PurR-regulated permease PerM
MEANKQTDEYLPKQDLILIISGYTLFFVFLYVIKETISPVLLVLTVVCLLLPVIKYKAVKNLLFVILVLFIIWIAAGMMSVLQVFIIGVVIAYLLDPLIDIMERKMKRPLAVAIVLLAILLLMALMFFILIPLLVDTLTRFNVQSSLKSIRNIFTNTIYPYVDQYGFNRADLRHFWETKIIPAVEGMMGSVFSGLSNIGDFVIGFFKQVLYLFILPFFIYYVLVDWNKMMTGIRNIWAGEKQEKFNFMLDKVDKILSGYIRGLLIVAALNAIDVTILMYIFGHDYPILIGLLSGLFTFIPQFGVIISLIVNTLIGLIDSNPGFHIPVTLIVILAHNILETALISPKLVGKRINVHPALLIISIFVFSYLFGFAGLFLAAPLTAILVSIFTEKRKKAGSENLPVP